MGNNELLTQFHEGTLDLPLSRLVLYQGLDILAGGFGRLYVKDSRLIADLTVEVLNNDFKDLFLFRAKPAGLYTIHQDEMFRCESNSGDWSVTFRFSRPDWANPLNFRDEKRLIVSPQFTELSAPPTKREVDVKSVTTLVGKIELPARFLKATMTESHRNVHGKESLVRGKGSRDWFHLDEGDCRYSLELEEGGERARLSAMSKSAYFQHWPALWRWKSSVSFLVGQPLTVRCYRELNGASDKVFILDYEPDVFVRFPPPVTLTAHPDDIDDLLRRFLRTIGSKGNEFLVGNLEKCWHSAGTELYVSELCVSTAIEGIVGMLYKQVSSEIDVDKAKIKRAKKAAKKILATHLECDPETSKQVLAHVGNMQSMSGTQIFHAVYRKFGVVPATDDFKAWKAVRNSTAHGKSIKDSGLEERMASFSSCVSLLYQIIFGFIGYSGRGSRYSHTRDQKP